MTDTPVSPKPEDTPTAAALPPKRKWAPPALTKESSLAHTGMIQKPYYAGEIALGPPVSQLVGPSS
jgi:hypothetical protein